ncbi:hypothetical protein BRADI_3g46543v3 [Brachypodium distachyon]|uniref:Uncharacterized protein n=1 Tax=Brachypodium distachyon TaxID=15368 RepID=A0A2K2D3M5_BRADI|nr:hypothetical protein BRADI_3g46543v3 [Brachypodium distachyon]
MRAGGAKSSQLVIGSGGDDSFLQPVTSGVVTSSASIMPQWKEPERAWVGSGNPCDDADMDLFYAVTFSIRIWMMVRDWLGLAELNPSLWQDTDSVREWWDSNILGVGMRRKTIASITMLVIWELWNERNVRVFRDISTMPLIIFYKIKNETRNWAIAGAKHMSSIMSGE